MNEESPVFEWRKHTGLRKVSDGFEAWLRAKCITSRKQYKKKEWDSIVAGPLPFNEREKGIVEARKKFTCNIVGVNSNKLVQLEVFNGSNIVIPYLSIEIKGKYRYPNSGLFIGGGRLPVGTIKPNQRDIISYNCFNEYVDPEDVQVTVKPTPGPEDREQYYEFK